MKLYRNAIHWKRKVYNEIRRKDIPEDKEIRTRNMVEAIVTHNKKEYCWNIPVKILIKCKHDRPDIMICHREEKLCTIVEIIWPTDVNIKLKISEKEDTYTELLRNLQLLYLDYKFRFIPVIIGALG
eukprot:XP_014788340.1 PREDICTED: uncharacterized protein LOC106882245 [Octopus bimaculoides]